MRSWGLAGLAIAVVVVCALLFFKVRDSSVAQPEELTPTETERRDVDTRQRVDMTSPVRSPTRPVLETAPAIVPPPDGTDRTTALLAEDVPQRVLAAAAACYRDEPGRSERMRIGYTIRFVGGRGALSDVVLVSSELAMPRLEHCVIETLRQLEWRDAGAPDLEDQIEASISILDLKKRSSKLAP